MDVTRPRPWRRSLRTWAFALLAITLIAGLLALGSWQLQRRVWKLELMEHVAQRVGAPATPAPAAPQWPGINASAHAYRHISTSGVWLDAKSTWVQAATELGSGYWLLTPLRQADGTLLLVNRGFVAGEQRAAMDARLAQASTATEPVQVAGLLRISEPGGGFLRHNDAQANRWYSRDVQAIATARGLSGVAPYFLDQEAVPEAPAVSAQEPLRPVAGLTVIAFHNNHLAYALTWYALALLLAGGAWRVAREARLPHHHPETPTLNQDPAHARQP